jgi:NADH-quinone oxidoreductase subunit L
VEKILYTWFLSGEFQANVGFLVDPLSMVMMMVVSGVSFIIHIYSHGYMHDDPDFPRYFTYLNLFVFFMLILVSANNFLLLFVGWEGVGLCSYFLIGFWYEKKTAADAGKKAFIVNRIGDYGFLLAIFLIFVVAVIGAATAIFAASIGLAQNDIKRVLAYSTISQLGYMFLACGVGAFTAGIFHLMTHAFFKALLFLGAGSVMHAMAGELDMRKMGALKPHMPRTYWTFLIATLAIAGIFPFAGFFSKDEILWQALNQGGILFWLIGAVAAFMTATYMFRAVFMTFHGKSRVDHEVAHHLHESPGMMTVPLILLAILSVIGGLVGFPIIEGGNKFAEFLAPVFALPAGFPKAAEAGHHAVSFEVAMMIISMAIAGLGILLAYRMYIKNPALPDRLAERFKAPYDALVNKYWVDEIYHFLFVGPLIRLSVFLWRFFDDLIVDGMVNGVAALFRGGSEVFKRLQTGNVQNYALSILIGIVFMIGYFLLQQ